MLWYLIGKELRALMTLLHHSANGILTLILLYFPLVAVILPTALVSCCPSSSTHSDFFSLPILVKLAAMPDFARVYNFLGSIFDPATNGHLQKLKEMDPIDAETVFPSLRFHLRPIHLSICCSCFQVWSSYLNSTFCIDPTFYTDSILPLEPSFWQLFFFLFSKMGCIVHMVCLLNVLCLMILISRYCCWWKICQST